MPSEASAWSTVREKLKAHRAHVQRFEDKLSSGIPDANVCLNGVEFWLEGKFLADYPKRDGTLVKLGLRPEQRVWAKQRIAAGGTVLTWARVPDGWTLFYNEPDVVFEGIPFGLWKGRVKVWPTAEKMVDAMLVYTGAHSLFGEFEKDDSE